MKVKVSGIQDPIVIIRRPDHANYIRELSESINALGLINPLTVRKTNVGWQLVAGYYRLQAVKALKWEEVDVTEFDGGDARALAATVVENMQRRPQDPLSEARIIAVLNKQHEMSQQEIAALFGKSQPWVSARLKLLNMRPSIQEAIQTQAIPAEVVLTLSTVDDETWVETMIAAAITGNWTLLQARAAVQSYNEAHGENGERSTTSNGAEITKKSGACWFCGNVLALSDGRQPFVCQNCLTEALQMFAKAGNKIRVER